MIKHVKRQATVEIEVEVPVCDECGKEGPEIEPGLDWSGRQLCPRSWFLITLAAQHMAALVCSPICGLIVMDRATRGEADKN